MPAIAIHDGAAVTAKVSAIAEGENNKETGPRNPITRKAVEKLCLQQGFYKTPHCNDKLYLHHKGYDKIADLLEYTECRVLWLEGNAISRIEGLEGMKDSLRCLYLHENCLDSLDGIAICSKLDALNVSDNQIARLDGFLGQPETMMAEAEGVEAADVAPAADRRTTFQRPTPADTLTTLQAKNNKLRTRDDIAVLLRFKNLSVLDLSGNELEGGDDVLDIVSKLPALKSLKLSGNPFVRRTQNYRKTVIAACKGLLHLDDKPVFSDERRLVTAWAAGGAEGEKAERAKIKEEEDEKVARRLREFREFVENARAEVAAAEDGATSSDESGSSDAEGGGASTDGVTAEQVTSSNISHTSAKSSERAASENGDEPPPLVALSDAESPGTPAAAHVDPTADLSRHRLAETEDDEEEEGDAWTPE